jgi:hypothetical protein
MTDHQDVDDQHKQPETLKEPSTDGQSQAATQTKGSATKFMRAEEWTRDHVIQALLAAIGLGYVTLTFLLWCNAERTTRLTNRAWIGPSPSVVFHVQADGTCTQIRTSPLQDGERPSICVFLINSGKTPAINVRHMTSVRFAPDHEQMPRNPLTPDATVFPETTMGFISGASYNTKSGDLPLFIRVTVCYEDIFRKHHFTTIYRVTEWQAPDHFSYGSGENIDDGPNAPDAVEQECLK